MMTFFMFGKYTAESIRSMSIERTERAVAAIQKQGGHIDAMHALLGEYDLLFCVRFPGVDEAMKASVTLMRDTGIGFTTCPAVTVEVFDRLVSKQ